MAAVEATGSTGALIMRSECENSAGSDERINGVGAADVQVLKTGHGVVVRLWFGVGFDDSGFGIAQGRPEAALFRARAYMQL